MMHLRPFTTLSLGLALLWANVAHASNSVDETPSTSVVGGQNAKECAWPAVFFIKTKAKTGEGMCTATLVHPRVLLYAAHCGVVLHARIGEDIIAPTKVLEAEDIESSQAYPDYQWLVDVEHDWAYAVLKEPILDIPIVPVAHGCEYDQLVKAGKEVHLVGFSPNKRSNEANPEPKEGNYPLRWATSKVGSVSQKGRLTTGGNGVHGCGGDSGGPLMSRLPDGSWRTIGITSTLTGKCREQNAYASYSHVRKEMIAWVEKESGFDITPCYDLDGKPTPSPACDIARAYADSPNAPKGTRDKNCSQASTVLVREACKVPESGEPQPDTTSTTGSDDSSEESSSGEGSTTGGSDNDTTSDPGSSDNTGTEDPGGESPTGEDTQDSQDSQTSPSQTPEQDPEPSPDTPKPEASSPSSNKTPKGENSGEELTESGCATNPAQPPLVWLLGILWLGRRRRLKTEA